MTGSFAFIHCFCDSGLDMGPKGDVEARITAYFQFYQPSTRGGTGDQLERSAYSKWHQNLHCVCLLLCEHAQPEFGQYTPTQKCSPADRVMVGEGGLCSLGSVSCSTSQELYRIGYGWRQAKSFSVESVQDLR